MAFTTLVLAVLVVLLIGLDYLATVRPNWKASSIEKQALHKARNIFHVSKDPAVQAMGRDLTVALQEASSIRRKEAQGAAVVTVLLLAVFWTVLLVGL